VRPVLADTGPIYALVDPDDRFHDRAMSEAARIAEQGRTLVVAFPTLIESQSLILKRLGFRVARRWLAELTAGAGLLNPHRDDYLAAARRLRSFADQPITLCDAVVTVLADQLSLSVWTFDHHFDVMGAAVWR
jgi:predicted nucleic acid-binding protein